MKYMGSKRVMLENGLGELIRSQAEQANRIIDPFCGSSVIAWYAAEQTENQVIASDLQEYAVILARAVLNRTATLEADKLIEKWFTEAGDTTKSSIGYDKAVHHSQKSKDCFSQAFDYVALARTLCASIEGEVVWKAYGGYYLSPLQALIFDALRLSLPKDEPYRTVCLAALISAASACAASPGHTAQPFQPTPKAVKYLLEAWQRDPFYYCNKALREICKRHAKVIGNAYVQDAVELASDVQENDLLILDPPYSSVHYSRFYHVLETIARGECGPVEGSGRYPPKCERPQSLFSLKSYSEATLSLLLSKLSARRTLVILTFPAESSSNGLTGEKVLQIARNYFQVDKQLVKSYFSTLGGNREHRPARQSLQELILLLKPQ